MPESRPSAPEAGRPGSGAGSGIIPSNVSESGAGIPHSDAEAGNVQAGRAGPSGAVASAKASPIHWAQPHAPGSSAPPPAEKKLWVKLGSETDPILDRIKLILTMFPGTQQMIIYCDREKKRIGTRCLIHEGLVAELQELLGEKNVVVK